VGKRFGMKEVGEDEDWSLFWTDYSVALERCMDMKRYQVRNGFSFVKLQVHLMFKIWLLFYLSENQSFSRNDRNM
jgi:hypothetical protein